VTHRGSRTSVLRVFTIAATLTTSYHIGTVRRYPVDVNWSPALLILCPCGHVPRFIVGAVPDQNVPANAPLSWVAVKRWTPDQNRPRPGADPQVPAWVNPGVVPGRRSVYGRRRAEAAYKWQHSSWSTAMLARWSSALV
jgi:hypothetical protein